MWITFIWTAAICNLNLFKQNNMKKQVKKIGSGRLPNEGETKRSYTVSLYPSRRDKLIKKYGSLTLALGKLKED